MSNYSRNELSHRRIPINSHDRDLLNIICSHSAVWLCSWRAVSIEDRRFGGCWKRKLRNFHFTRFCTLSSVFDYDPVCVFCHYNLILLTACTWIPCFIRNNCILSMLWKQPFQFANELIKIDKWVIAKSIFWLTFSLSIRSFVKRLCNKIFVLILAFDHIFRWVNIFIGQSPFRKC